MAANENNKEQLKHTYNKNYITLLPHPCRPQLPASTQTSLRSAGKADRSQPS